MRIAPATIAALAVLVTLLTAATRAQAEATSPPTPAPKADAGPAAPPKASPSPRASPPPAGTVTKPPPAAASDLARALLTSEQWSKILDSYASSLAGQVSQALQAKGEKVPDNLRPNLRAELEKTLPYQQTVQAQAEALAKTLSPEELRRTAAFYGSPLGRKVLDKLPEAQSEVAQELQGRLSTAVPDIVNRLAPRAMASGPAGAAPDGERGGAGDHATGTGSSAPGAAGAESGPPPGAGKAQ